MAEHRSRGVPSGGGYSAPVVNISDRSSWQGVAVLGMLTVQFALLVLIAWRMLTVDSMATGSQKTDAVQLAATRQTLDQIVDRLPDGYEGVVDSLEERNLQYEELETAGAGLFARIRELERAQGALSADKADLVVVFD